MPNDYAMLAPYYNRLGLDEFARTITPRIFTEAQKRGWMGRQILDIGTGTGEGAVWLAQHGYIVVGLDTSSEMLAIAKERFASASANFAAQRQDIRTFTSGGYDLGLALGFVNELDGIKDVEQVFQAVHQNLKPERWFIFDLWTIEGLMMQGAIGDQVLVNAKDLLVLAQHELDYDRQMLTRRYQFVSAAGGQHWRREQMNHVGRAYPTQAVLALLQRIGFTIVATLKPNLEPYEPGKTGVARIIIFAQKK